MTDYVTLGRSGLRVSPLCLGTMTFGTDWGWGSEENVARTVFDRYIDVGGNFLDTADAYTEGHSEELLGKFIRERGLRDRVVLATKFTFNSEPGNPNTLEALTNGGERRAGKPQHSPFPSESSMQGWVVTMRQPKHCERFCF